MSERRIAPGGTRVPWVSVLIPTWNEAAGLEACIRSIGARDDEVEVIVADGGSDDGTAVLAGKLGATVVASPVRQRAAQLNLAAERARGEVLVFLHADTRLPEGWRAVLREALEADDRVFGGAFRRRFEHPSAWLRFTCRLADWRGRWCGWFLGDQAMFVRAAVFRRLGGLATIDVAEDLEFSARLASAGPTVMLPATVRSSGRRFDRRGPVGQTLRDLVSATVFLLRCALFAPAGPATPLDELGKKAAPGRSKW